MRLQYATARRLRRKFDEVLLKECERAERSDLPLTLMVADIDHFKTVNDSFPVVGRKTCCFGVTQYRPGEAPEATVKRADDALYRAKNEGRDQVCAG